MFPIIQFNLHNHIEKEKTMGDYQSNKVEKIEVKGKLSTFQWISLIFAIPLSVVFSFFLTFGEFKNKIENLESNHSQLYPLNIGNQIWNIGKL